MTALSDLAAGVVAVSVRAKDRPADWLRLLPLQDETLRDPAKVRLIRHGNQTIGKTITGCLDLVGTTTGIHPWCPQLVRTDRPIEAIVIFGDKQQSLGIQKKLFELIPAELLHPSTRFDPARGLISRTQTFKIRHVPTGGWSVVRFKTVEQGPLALMGLTADYVWIDEPPTEAVFDEALRRLQQAGRWGRLLLTMTPINRPCDWIRMRCESGAISDHWRPLTPAELIPIGATRPICTEDGVPKDAAWIAMIRREVPDWLAPVRIDGEWETRVVERVFTSFRSGGAQSHVHNREPDVDTEVHVGIDYSTRIGKQVAILALVDPRTKSVYVLDEDVDQLGRSTTEQDATRLLGMLERHGLEWANVDQAWGDRLLLAGPLASKSNRDLQVEIARQLGLSSADEVHPAIRTVKRGKGAGRGSVDAGVQWIHRAMVDGAFAVHPRCTRLIECLEKWDGRDNDLKDPIDALRYALQTLVFRAAQRGQRPAIASF